MRAFLLSDRRSSALVVLVSGLLAAGCVSTSLRLPPDHPAQPAGPAPLSSEPGAILRPGAGLFPFSGSVGSEASQAAAPSATEVAQQEGDGTREAPFVGRGVIQRIETGRLEIRHGDIPGFMPAMTMPFPMADDLERDALDVGDEIIFSIEFAPGGGPQIFRVEEVPGDPDQAPATEGNQNRDPPTSEP